MILGRHADMPSNRVVAVSTWLVTDVIKRDRLLTDDCSHRQDARFTGSDKTSRVIFSSRDLVHARAQSDQ